MSDSPAPAARSDAFEIGIYSFAELTPDPATGEMISPAQRLRNLLETIELADQTVWTSLPWASTIAPTSSPPRPPSSWPRPPARTQSIRLSSAVTVLSSDDPVRVFQNFATLDLLSNGRAEIMAGRGSFIESFPLFGYDLDDYNELFSEKLDLLLTLRESERVTWSGKHRPTLQGQGIYPRPLQEQLPVWIAVGGTAESPSRARARWGCPWRSPSSAACRNASRPWCSSTGSRRSRPGMTPRSCP